MKAFHFNLYVGIPTDCSLTECSTKSIGERYISKCTCRVFREQ